MTTLEGYRSIDTETGRVVIAKVTPECEFSPLLTEEDAEYLATLVSPARRAQWSTCRVIIRSLLGSEAKLRYAISGALVLESPVGEVKYLSLSHSEKWVAVMFSSRRCGVDIEALGRNFSRVASCYISHDERAQFESKVGGEFEAIMWSAEEALYKYGSNPGLDFIQDMVITSFDTENQTISAELYGLITPDVHYQTIEDHILCYLSDKR
jgi:4'-phosphopantetheinyl transferase EntD